jgi:dihydroorotate dehydrogenase
MSILHELGTILLRKLPAENAHKLTIKALGKGLGPKSNSSISSGLEINVGGLTLPNPVGLAAGFDKDCEVSTPMLAAGFGFVECGTVTPLAQLGNPKPRLFRLVEDKAVVNRMGFNNAGLDKFKNNLEKRKLKNGLVGANLGANKNSKNRVEDYAIGLRALWGLSDYFTINISSPNTPGLRDLQNENAMDELLGRVSEVRAELTGDKPSFPIFLKVAPDLGLGEIERIVEQSRSYGINALIVSNTTIARPSSLKSRYKTEKGGLSGQPLFESSTEILRQFYAAAKGKIDLIGVGGVSNGQQAYEKIRAGARAVQIYSALVYEGPGLVNSITTDLLLRLKADGFSSLAEAVGVD